VQGLELRDVGDGHPFGLAQVLLQEVELREVHGATAVPVEDIHRLNGALGGRGVAEGVQARMDLVEIEVTAVVRVRGPELVPEQSNVVLAELDQEL